MRLQAEPPPSRSREARREPAARLPVVFVVDRDRGSLAVVVSDLSRRFGSDFDVRGETSQEVAVARLREMAAAGETIALVLVDAEASDVLACAHELHPLAKRVLLVDRDYSSRSPAVRAITLGQADFHLVRPWADDENMYRTMSEYLSSWTSEQEPSFELFRIIASEHDGRLPQLRDVMTRLSLPFGFYPDDSDAGHELLREAGLAPGGPPVVLRNDGVVLVDPSLAEMASAFGVSVKNDAQTCDVAIVGAGPAGLSAAVYAASEGLETVLLEQAVSGGQAGTSPLIRNYPGFPHGVEGGLLMERTCEQAWLMGAQIVFAQRVVALERGEGCRVLRLLDGSELRARSVVIATGIDWRRLGVPRVEALVGAGVFYGAGAGESRAMDDQEVLLVGAGNSAGQAALHLARHARTVTLLVRGDSLARSMSSYLVRGIESTANVHVRLRAEVLDAYGEEQLECVRVADRERGTTEDLRASALFIMIGGEPHTEWLPEELDRDGQGYVVTGREVLERRGAAWELDREPLPLETSMPGVFAAGDVRQDSLKRVASAVGEGATVVRLLHEHLRGQVGASQPADPAVGAPS
jgi:thioredoxin reductase (NADPH)